MSRLASFQGPSTPSKSPVTPSGDNNDANEGSRTPNKNKNTSKSKKSKSNSSNTPARTPIATSPPTSPVSQISPGKTVSPSSKLPSRTINSDIHLGEESAFVETSTHKKLRQTLLEIRGTARKWDELSRADGFKYAKEMIDVRTGIENELALVPKGSWPQSPVVGPKMIIINERLRFLDEVLEKMQTLFDRLVSLVDSVEALYVDAVNKLHSLPSNNPSTKNSNTTANTNNTATAPLDPDSPLYPTTTWSLSHFSNVITSIIVPYYHKSLHSHRYMIAELRKPDIKWETARKILAVWRENPLSLRRLAQLQSEASTSALKGFNTGDSSFIFAEGVYWPPGWSEDLEEICKIEILGWK